MFGCTVYYQKEFEYMLQFKDETRIRIGIGADVDFLPDFNEAKHLQELFFGWNELKFLPDIEKLENLEELEICHNKLIALPSLEKLANLQDLDVEHNKLTALPERILKIKYVATDPNNYPKWLKYERLVE